ncbi:MAG: hypothetical protein H2045_09715 [Rhizobiales bacterium]|nr:hypothetical protein [Hyphomicrobiales bacterium]
MFYQQVNQRILSTVLTILFLLVAPSGVHATDFQGAQLPEGKATIAITPNKQTSALNDQQKFVRQQLVDTVLFYDRHLRVDATGQYLDRVDLDNVRQDSLVSSIASTAIGLISLTIGDQLGVVDDAAEKARITLANLLNTDEDALFKTPRSKSGWFKHFINPYTGDSQDASGEKFSTIDTTLLGIGASMTARYFGSKSDADPQARAAARLAQSLVDGVDWGQAMRFGDRPGMHQVFWGAEEKIENGYWSLPFDEYVVIPCLGRSVESSRGVAGPASVFWDKYIADTTNLPQKDYDGHTVLAVDSREFTSHFNHQFAFFFCGELANDPIYRAELAELMRADQKWFENVGAGALPKRWWGLGAGSELKFDPNSGAVLYSAYGVAQIDRNPHLTFSPAIMAGFLPVENNGAASGNSEIVNDLMALYASDECRYRFAGLDILWRCSARDPKLRVREVEGVDLSTYMLGLAWSDPAVGPQFFADYGVKSRPAGEPVIEDIRASLMPSAPSAAAPSGKK